MREPELKEFFFQKKKKKQKHTARGGRVKKTKIVGNNKKKAGCVRGVCVCACVWKRSKGCRFPRAAPQKKKPLVVQ